MSMTSAAEAVRRIFRVDDVDCAMARIREHYRKRFYPNWIGLCKEQRDGAPNAAADAYTPLRHSANGEGHLLFRGILCVFLLGSIALVWSSTAALQRPAGGWSDEEPSRSHQQARTPPRGWNSFDAYTWKVTESEFLRNCEAVARELKPFGYEYCIVDYLWFQELEGSLPEQPRATDPITTVHVDAYGRAMPAPDRWPSTQDENGNSLGFKPIADRVHRLGMKLGLHVMRGVPVTAVERKTPVLGTTHTAEDIAVMSDPCPWWGGVVSVNVSHPAGRSYYDSLYRQFAEWGVDYIKNDCVFGDSFSYEQIRVQSEALGKAGRPMIYSVSPGSARKAGTGDGVRDAQRIAPLVNMYRVTADDWDAWDKLVDHFHVAACFAKAGLIGSTGLDGLSWPDLDMLPFGVISTPGSGKPPHRRTSLTEAQQYTQMTLWAIAKSPLVFGGAATRLDPFTRRLLTTAAVLELNAASFGAREVLRDPSRAVWTARGSRHLAYVALFNLANASAPLAIDYASLGLAGFERCTQTDLWTGRAHEQAGPRAVGAVVPANGVLLVGLTGCAGLPRVAVTVPSSAAVAVTEAAYASWNVDPSCNRGFHHISFSNPNLAAAARGLEPSRLRFGGAGGDNLEYALTEASGAECGRRRARAPGPHECGYTTPGCLNASHWEALYGFSRRGGAEFIFAVAFGEDQACSEGSAYSWNSTNAAGLLAYMSAHDQRVFGFELGNELNWKAEPPCNLTAAQQAAALLALRGLVRAGGQEGVRDAVYIGPDTGRPRREGEEWLKQYLPLVSRGAPRQRVIHAVTHHVYPDITRENFNTPAALDSTRQEIAWYTSLIAGLAPGAQVWAGENGPVAGGQNGTCGDASVCGTYASALWYADDLALRALHGFAQYQRQAFIGGAYGLTDSVGPHFQSGLGPSEALALRPDYWVNFLWKRTVGRRVHAAASSAPGVRAYAFSGAPPSPCAAEECTRGGLQVLLINLSKEQHVSASLPPRWGPSGRASRGRGRRSEDASLPPRWGPSGRASRGRGRRSEDAAYAAWILEPPPAPTAGPGSPADPFSKRVRLNAVLLPDVVDLAGTAQKHGPAFLRWIPAAAVRGRVEGGLLLPPLSVSFVCYYDSNAV